MHTLNELKCVDVGSGLANFETNLGANTGMSLINGLKEGTGYWNRVGARVAMKSVHIRIALVSTTQTIGIDTAGATYRFFLLYDSQSNGALPTFGQVFQNTDVTGAQSTQTEAGVNVEYRERFLILKDWIFSTPAEQSTAAASVTLDQYGPRLPRQIEWYVPLKKLETIYQKGSAGTIADIKTGALILGAYANGNSLGATATLMFRYQPQYRLRYWD